jgi:hypothetical protein
VHVYQRWEIQDTPQANQETEWLFTGEMTATDQADNDE